MRLTRAIDFFNERSDVPFIKVDFNRRYSLLIQKHIRNSDPRFMPRKDDTPDLYLIYVRDMVEHRNLSKKESYKHREVFVSLVGAKAYALLELLLALDHDRHYNKGPGLTYLNLSSEHVIEFLKALSEHNHNLLKERG